MNIYILHVIICCQIYFDFYLKYLFIHSRQICKIRWSTLWYSYVWELLHSHGRAKTELAHRGFITIGNPRPFWLNLLITLGEILVYTSLFSIIATIFFFVVIFFIFEFISPDSVTWVSLHNPSFLAIATPLFFLTFIVPIFNALNKAMNLWRFFVSEKRGIMDYNSIITAESTKTFSGASFIDNIIGLIRERKPEMFGYLIILIFVLLRIFPLQFLLALSCFMIVAIFWRPIFLHFHPLYAFAYLWESIRDRATEIETQSRLIQEGFGKQWGYQGLRWPFDTLSYNFRELITLVLKLEQCEKKIHGGDIFDAQKYIDSLRSDIRIPLVSLRAFFESQKAELIQAQNEMMRVRVWPSGLSWQEILTSDRSMMILQEIDTTIMKLDDMIIKIGGIPLNTSWENIEWTP